VTARGEGDVNDTPQQSTSFVVPFGLIEPHAGLLIAPPEGQSLYKMMTVENLLRSIAGSYLHFNRVDAYQDLTQVTVPNCQAINRAMRWPHSCMMSAANYDAAGNMTGSHRGGNWTPIIPASPSSFQKWVHNL
jgi:hypothetical protein